MTSSNIFFDIIFVSPMNRTIQTTKLTLEKHNISYNKIYVLAGLTEVMKNICDFGNSI
jgi:broad specificity phosphatase PhoE